MALQILLPIGAVALGALALGHGRKAAAVPADVAAQFRSALAQDPSIATGVWANYASANSPYEPQARKVMLARKATSGKADIDALYASGLSLCASSPDLSQVKSIADKLAPQYPVLAMHLRNLISILGSSK